MNDLLLDAGAHRISRAALQAIPTPEPTSSWKPVSHHQAANLVLGEALVRGFNVTSEEYGVNPSETKMFGVLRFHPEGHPEWSRALGLRNSHDKSIALGLTAGLSVLVCSNLCFGGETTIHRRHTSGIDITGLIPEAFDSLELQFARLESRVEILKVMRLRENKAPYCAAFYVKKTISSGKNRWLEINNWIIIRNSLEMKFSTRNSALFHPD